MIGPLSFHLAVAFVIYTLYLGEAVAQEAHAPRSKDHRKPSMVFIVSDDQGYGDLGCYGNPNIRTPHLDRLAREGARLTSFYAQPTCSPSRASLLTGRVPDRHGLTRALIKTNYVHGGLNRDELLLPELLKPSGYATGCIGKWHLGWADGMQPGQRGFDEFFGHASGLIDYFTHQTRDPKTSDPVAPDLFRGAEPAKADGYSTDVFTDAAIGFIERQREKPFFLFLAYNAPHYPATRDELLQAPQQYLDLYLQEKNLERRHYLAAVTAMDAGIGRVLTRLDELGLAEDTLVVFLSDNGGSLRHGGTNTPLRGEKGTLCEGGIRVPCIIRWPKPIKPGTVCAEPLTVTDLFSFALATAGVEPPAGRIIDGRDPTATLTESAPSPHNFICFTYPGDQWAVREGQYKLCQTPELKGARKLAMGLYDVVSDPGETQDLSQKRPDLVAHLEQLFAKWKTDLATKTQP